MKTMYEQQIDKFIPDAVKYANAVILLLDPEHGPQIIGNNKTTLIRLSRLTASKRVSYKECIGKWNQLFHSKMDQLTHAAGIR